MRIAASEHERRFAWLDEVEREARLEKQWDEAIDLFLLDCGLDEAPPHSIGAYNE